MADNIWISVIIPIYNGEKFLSRAVDSVVCQMNGEIELILVNDGSTDGSGAICDEYAKKHNGIKVIHRENGGLSAARNSGIKAADGVYLSFLDCDDYVEQDTYEKILPRLKSFKPDCLDFGFKYIGVAGDISYNHHKIKKEMLLGRESIESVILPPLLNLYKDDEHFIFNFAWNKLYRKDIVEKNNIYFKESRGTWEDRPFVIEYLNYCKTYYSIRKHLYNYIYVPNSLSQRYTTEYFRIILENFCNYRRMFGDKYDFDTDYVNGYWSNSIWRIVLLSLNQNDTSGTIREAVFDTLKNDQVKHWFAHRVPKNNEERKISALVVSGKTEELLKYARKLKNRDRRKKRIKSIISSAKSRLKRILKR